MMLNIFVMYTYQIKDPHSLGSLKAEKRLKLVNKNGVFKADFKTMSFPNSDDPTKATGIKYKKKKITYKPPLLSVIIKWSNN